MTPKLLIRIASGCTLFFAFGHSMGHVTRRDMDDPKAKEVIQTMINNKFDLFGHPTSYDGMYTGMSLNLVFTLLAFVLILWHISNISVTEAKTARKLLLPIIACTLGFAVTSFLYFFPVPAITCLVGALLLIVALVKLNANKDDRTSTEIKLPNARQPMARTTSDPG